MIYLITILIATLCSTSLFSQTNCEEARQKYWILYPDVANAKFDPFQHYQIHGKNEGRVWPSCKGEEKDCENAKSQYYKLYPDVFNAGVDAWTHYQTHGNKEGRVWPFCSNVQDNSNNNNSGSISDQFMNYLTRTEWIVTEFEPSFAKAYYGAKCKFTKTSFSYVPRYKGVYLDEIKYKIDILGVQENFPEGSKYSGAFNFHNLQQRNDTQQHAFVYLKEDVVLWKSGFQGYTVNLVLTRAR